MMFNPSQQLSRSPVVKALGALVVVVVLSTAVSLVVQLPISFWTQYVSFREASQGNLVDLRETMSRVLWISLPFSVLSGLAQLGVSLYSNFIFSALYTDQRRRREGDDISERLDRLHPAADAVESPAEDGWDDESWTLPTREPSE